MTELTDGTSTETNQNTICLLDDVRDVFFELLRNYCLNARRYSLRDASMLMMASRASRDLVLSCIETLDFSYLYWFSVSTSPMYSIQENFRPAFLTDKLHRDAWSRHRCLSFALKTMKMPKLRYLDISGLKIESDKEMQLLLDSLGATRLHTLKAQFLMEDRMLSSILNHSSGNLAATLKHLDVSHCTKLSSSCLLLLSEKCPQLEDLIWFAHFRTASDLADFPKNFEVLVERCPNLRKFVAPAYFNSFSQYDYSWMNCITKKFELLGVSTIYRPPRTNNVDVPNELLASAAPHVTHLKNIVMPTAVYMRHSMNLSAPVIGSYGQFLVSSGETSVHHALELCAKKSKELHLHPASLVDFETDFVPTLMLPFYSYYSDIFVLDRFLEVGFDAFATAYHGLNAFAAVALEHKVESLIRILSRADAISGEITGKQVYPSSIANFNMLGFNLLHACALWGRNRSTFGWILNQKSLEKFQLNINAQDIFGCTPLYYAVMSDTRNMTRQLLQNGARIDLRAHFGNRDTPCTLAVRNGCGPKLLSRLLPRQVLDEWAEQEPEWALCAALLMGRKRLLRKLILDRYKDENKRRQLLVDAESIFPLAVAIIRSSDSLFGYVLSQMPYFFDCIDISKRYDPRGRIGVTEGTVLHMAIVVDRPKTLKLLLEKFGADATECDTDGRMPLQLAIQYPNSCLDLVPLLLQRMIQKNPQSVNHHDSAVGFTALHWAGLLRSHAASITRTLLSCPGIDKEPRDNLNRTPIAMTKSRDVLDVFAEFGIHPQQEENEET